MAFPMQAITTSNSTCAPGPGYLEFSVGYRHFPDLRVIRPAISHRVLTTRSSVRNGCASDGFWDMSHSHMPVRRSELSQIGRRFARLIQVLSIPPQRHIREPGLNLMATRAPVAASVDELACRVPVLSGQNRTRLLDSSAWCLRLHQGPVLSGLGRQYFLWNGMP